MIKIKFNNDETFYPCGFSRINDHVVALAGDLPRNTSGFTTYKYADEMQLGDFSDYATIYKDLEDSILFSNDGSVYTEPIIVEQEYDSHMYTPTLDDVKQSKHNEIRNKCQEIITSGVQVGEHHFSLTVEDQLNLFGTQSLIANGELIIPYHADGEECIFFTVDEMKKILSVAMAHVTLNTTICNSYYTWIKACETIDEVKAIEWGVEIPSEYQSDVYKNIVAPVVTE